MVKPKLGDNLSISAKLKNFFFGEQIEGFRPRIGVLYQPKKIRINRNYSKEVPGRPQGFGVDYWTKRVRTSIGVKARYHNELLSCNFKVENENTCFIYLRKPHSKEILATLKLPISNTTFHKEVYKKNGWLNVKYIVEIGKLSKANAEIMRNYCFNLKTQDIEKHFRKPIVRRRGTAIIDTPKGILVTSHRNTWLLPGGGTKRGESREKAAIRELKEETGLSTKNCKYLFTYNEPESRRIRNMHKVFLIDAEGIPKPNHHDVHYIAWWKPDSGMELSPTTMLLIKKYLSEFKR